MWLWDLEFGNMGFIGMFKSKWTILSLKDVVIFKEDCKKH